ncbi:ribonuclease 3-like protein 1 isoform X2 [Arabidopsis lyrata subsp. lyrata]|uniref:ribonuclease 3-like protein 1 isoform X2 n=1 Tax=Arabidopsis lyrata subsp. lyrata TaxID=81972 RepID=UPI000A29BA8E|nr:ribonuclease 3-like protein 1 isoform X2 [Arabidopsis lyrata subsp. lyrata]|eukprot:XP_020870836.1 ribonuclease 3-like protein 1 isoform X2 [Arabidopsis lyrata subsp. lyrata]
MYLPPLESSPNPTSSSSVRCEKRMMLQRCESGFKLRKLNDAVEEDIVTQMESNITHENTLVSEPEATLGPQTTEPTTEETQRSSAKSQLYKFCSVRHWKAPVYECIAEGPCHMILFTVKATVEMKEDSRITVLECFGDPQHKKKIAAEQAAEAALWYLKNVGHTLQTEKASGHKGQIKPISKMMGTGEPV